MNQFAEAKYITIFYEDQVNIYDATNTKVTVLRGSVLRGWRLRDKGLWRIPLVANVKNVNTERIILNKLPSSFLVNNEPLPTDEILNAYGMKTRPELLRFYHAAAGFPTKPTWLAAIENSHYASWTGLNYSSVTKYFPESEET